MIRAAAPADVPVLLTMIRELAAYERSPEAVHAEESSVQTALFGTSPRVFALVATDGDVPVGFAAWFVSFSTWTGRHGIYLEDLYVRPTHRGAGHGRALLAELARIALARGYPRLEWSVLDWNSPAIDFYRSLDAEPMTEWTTWRATGPALTRLASPGTRDSRYG